MTAEKRERSDYYVYVCRIGGRIVYVGKGCGYRMNRHWKTSHNPELNERISIATDHDAPIQFRKLRSGLTNLDALRLEAKCFEKWRDTLCNRNNPYRALEGERAEAEWDEMYEAGEFNAFLIDYDAIEAHYAIEEGRLTRAEAIERGLIEDDEETGSGA